MKHAIALLLFLNIFWLKAQENGSQLNQYVNEAISGNLALQEQVLSLESSMAALEEARGLFLPSVGIEARYSRADGGRTIDFPIGTIINPIYQTLNGLLGAQAFDRPLQDQQINFLREQEHDTRLRLVQPLFNTALINNYRVRKQQKIMADVAVRAFARQLVADVKSAYYRHASALAVEDLMRSTAALLEENLRVSESLVKNNKATSDVVFRAQAELSQARQDILDAEKNVALTRSAFNLLLNRPLETMVIVEEFTLAGQTSFPDLPAAITHALSRREEFAQLSAARSAGKHAVSIEKSRFLPNLNLGADYGFQGVNYRFNDEDDFWMISLVLRWNLFNGGQDRARVQQAKIAVRQLEQNEQYLTRQIEMAVQQSWFELQVAESALETAEQQVTASEKVFKIVDRKYRNGLATQIEFLDARTRLTGAHVAKIISENRIAQKSAGLEQQAALLDIEPLLSTIINNSQ